MRFWLRERPCMGKGSTGNASNPPRLEGGQPCGGGRGGHAGDGGCQGSFPAAVPALVAPWRGLHGPRGHSGGISSSGGHGRASQGNVQLKAYAF